MCSSEANCKNSKTVWQTVSIKKRWHIMDLFIWFSAVCKWLYTCMLRQFLLNFSSGSSDYDTVCNQCATNHFKNGSRCELCHDTCRGNVSSNISLCYEVGGHCIFGCKAGYYGSPCDKQCNNNCQENTTSDFPICDLQNGTCSFGCKDVLTYGPMCDKPCGHLCMNSVCDRDGTCRGWRYHHFGRR